MLLKNTITLYNNTAKKENTANWKKTVLKNVRVIIKTEKKKSSAQENRSATVYIFDSRVKSDSMFILRPFFDSLFDKSSFYTLSAGDCFVLGECGSEFPPENHFAVTEVVFFDHPLHRLSHKRIRAV